MSDKPEFSFQWNPHPLRDRSVLVAGGSGGLGSATTELLVREGARVTVGFHSNRDRAERLRQHLQRTCGKSIELVEGDIADPEVRSRYIETAARSGEGLYGLVCFTGDPGRVKFDRVTQEELLESMIRNYTGPLLLCREAERAMRAAGQSGAMVLISTMQAVAPFESSVNYAGPKTALIQAARILAKEWGGKDGIRVNVIAPGVNRAGMALQSIQSGKYDFFVEKGIIPRFGRAEDVARVVRLLVEPDNYMTGQVITVDGGLTLRRDRG